MVETILGIDHVMIGSVDETIAVSGDAAINRVVARWL